MSKTTTTILIALVSIALHCAHLHAQTDEPTQSVEAPPQPTVASVFSAEAMQLIKNADRIQAFRVDGSFETPIKAGEIELLGRRLLQVGPVLTPAQQRQLQDLVVKESSYRLDVHKKCLFQPGIVYRVWQADTYMNISVCFSCGEVQWSTRGGNPIATVDAVPSYAAHLALAKKLFPVDAELRKVSKAPKN